MEKFYSPTLFLSGKKNVNALFDHLINLEDWLNSDTGVTRVRRNKSHILLLSLGKKNQPAKNNRLLNLMD